jgi:hypothetical protein
MAYISGISYIKDSKGNNRKIIIDLKKWGEYLEDFIDMIDVKARENEERFPLSQVKDELDEYHKVKK